MPRHRLSKKRVKELFGVELIYPKDAASRTLTPDEFEAAFGIRPIPKLNPRQKKAAKIADELFVDMYLYYKKSTLVVLLEAASKLQPPLAEEQVRVLHSALLHNMSACPKFALKYMRRQLEPGYLHTHSTHFLNKRG